MLQRTHGTPEARSRDHASEDRAFRGLAWLLYHHGPEEAHHTVRLRLWGREVAICARCLGLYPTLLLVLWLEARFGQVALPSRWFWVWSLVTPAVIDYGRARLFAARGNSVVRMVTGVLAGIGLGFGFSDYFQDSNPTYFWILLAVLAVLVIWFWRIEHRGQSPP